ncbi:hypothetical protein PFDG_05063 [Plasmodium falciparum Dd2]|uniref:Uncharacterized protein n=1 Tax=Plasmodium falciparum (isolate Dd2) TaxID=57267 RepID=A0A0L7M9H1_PLAF4|nr:hypothetical protein PFDG_05063 [Plasmodium falciparum Dd2]
MNTNIQHLRSISKSANTDIPLTAKIKCWESSNNEKLTIESENDILKTDLTNMEEDLKKLEKHSYDIYEIKNHLEEVVHKK